MFVCALPPLLVYAFARHKLKFNIIISYDDHFAGILEFGAVSLKK
jgi:hypothetical protein